jgi:hypothetical protein
MASKRRPNWDRKTIHDRMVGARLRLGLEMKEAADKAGMSYWSWAKKESDEVGFSPSDCFTFAAAVGAPTLFPLYDWDHAEELDERLGWDK